MHRNVNGFSIVWRICDIYLRFLMIAMVNGAQNRLECVPSVDQVLTVVSFHKVTACPTCQHLIQADWPVI